MKKGLIVFCVLAMAVSSALAEEEIDLEKIVVTPTRIESEYDEASRKVDVITSRQIERSGAQDISAVLTDLPSVNISDYGGLGGLKNIRMRGSTAAQVLVMVDGRSVNNPRDGTIDLSGIPLDNINRIELMRGPASSLYGSSAMGGVVNIITKSPPKHGHQTEVVSGYGKFSTYTERLTHRARLSKFGYVISGGYQSSEGFRTNSDFNSKDFNAKFEYAFSDDNDLALNCGFYKSHKGTPGQITDPRPDDKQDDLKNFLDLKWALKPAETIELSSRIYNNYERLEAIEKTTTVTKDIHTTTARGFDLQYAQKFGDIYQVVGGFNYVENYNDSTSSAKHKYDIRAGFIDNKLELFDRLNLGLGLRVDDYSNFGSEPSPNFNAAYKINDRNKVHFLVSRSFRAPTFNDLYWPATSWAQGNSDLQPEKGTTLEAGFKSDINDYLSAGVTYYRSIYDKLINWAPQDNGVWTPSNIDSALIDGVELESGIRPLKYLEINFAYTFLRAKNDVTNKYLIYQPANKYDLSLVYKGFKGFIFELKGQMTGSRFHDANNRIKMKNFIALDLNISKKFCKEITAYLNFNNLLNKKYQVIRGYPVPAFSVDGRIKAEF